jgi:hypothetical protein
MQEFRLCFKMGNGLDCLTKCKQNPFCSLNSGHGAPPRPSVRTKRFAGAFVYDPIE